MSKVEKLCKTKIIKIKKDHDYYFVYKLKPKEIIKEKLIIECEKENLTSTINIKAVVVEDSYFDFEALLRIKKGAKNTDSYLKINTLVIGEESYVRAVPSLEIMENDVKAGHAATIGYVDSEQILYMLSRGLTKKEAENLIISGFLKKE